MADSRVNVPPESRRGDAFEVRISIRQRLTCRYNGDPVFAVRMSPGIAANPYLRFFVTARESGTLDFEWIDDAGVRGTAQAPIRVV